MKKNVCIILMTIGALLLTGCDSTPRRDMDRLINMSVISPTPDNKGIVSEGSFNIFFKANSDIPYFSIKDGKDLLESYRKVRISEKSYINYTVDNNKVILKDDFNSSVTFDMATQKITFSDFDAFNNYSYQYNGTLALFANSNKDYISAEDITYTKGEEYVIDLSLYDKLDICKYGDNFYIPLTTFNDLFLSVYTFSNLVYSPNGLFHLHDGVKFYTETPFGIEYTPIGRVYYRSKENNPTVSQEYAAFNYQSICLNFDYTYGVKGLKGRDYETFDDYLSQRGYKEDMLSGDVHKMDNAFAYALSYLNDFHTSYNTLSPLYPAGEGTLDRNKFNPAKILNEEGEELLKKLRMVSQADLGLTIDTYSRTAFIAFDSFDSIDAELLGKHEFTREEILSNSPALFACAYDIITTQYNDKIDYIIVDMATNDGGSSDALIYILSTLVGAFTLETQNPYTDGHSIAHYLADINRDGKYDENDKSFRELGKKIVFVNTSYAFSCGNALPVLAKNNYPDDVITMGETTGGGACVLRTAYNAIGASYFMSGTMMLSERDEEGNLVGIEYGVDPDIPLKKEETINRKLVLLELLKFYAD